MATDCSYRDLYTQYLQAQGVVMEAGLLAHLDEIIATINWDEPEKAADYQAIAVIALIEAEMAESLETRRLYVDMALQALDAAMNLGEPSLAMAQWAMVKSRLGDLSSAAQIAFHDLIMTAEGAYLAEHPASQLVYIPSESPGSSGLNVAEALVCFLSMPTLEEQRLVLAAEAFCRSQLVLYNAIGARALKILSQFFPQSVGLQRKQGIYQLANQELEGFIPLHRANARVAMEASANSLRSASALQLAAQQYQSAERAYPWKQQAQAIKTELGKETPAWLQTLAEDPCIYLPYDADICFAAEPTLTSLVTRVLLAEGDWFEHEMELWRSLIQPGMTVIDVGANSGVYTFSAAKRVGPSGKVIAIEPFKDCITGLNLTCDRNAFSWVRVYAAAASDQLGEAFLRLQGASELNELQLDEGSKAEGTATQRIDCITLDSLIESEQLERVDFLKIDAEGHETAVLEGSQQLISRFWPTILYENLAGSQGSNLSMGQALIQKGYRLFRYRAFVQQLVPVVLDESIEGALNLVAVAENRLSEMAALLADEY